VVLRDDEWAICPRRKEQVAWRGHFSPSLEILAAQPDMALGSRPSPGVSPQLSFSVICLGLNLLSPELLQRLYTGKRIRIPECDTFMTTICTGVII